MKSIAHLHIIALLFLAHIPFSLAFHFYLRQGEKRCFSESVPPNTKILGEYTVSTGHGTVPVNIKVTVDGSPGHIFLRENIDHGKFAFVVPYADFKGTMGAAHAEAHRKPSKHHDGAFKDNDLHLKARSHMGRKLLQIPEHHDNHHHPDPDELKYEGEGEELEKLLNEAHSEHYERKEKPPPRDPHEYYSSHHGKDNDHISKLDDEYDYEYDDDLDMENYEGIHDDWMDNEVEKNAQAHRADVGDSDSLSASGREAEIFDSRRFEVCVFTSGETSENQRRVRLVIHKGEAAHDYARLAKKEHMNQLEVSLRRVSDELHDLLHELDRTRQMEDVLRELHEGTKQQVILLSVLALVTMIGVAALQSSYTKRYFKRKKIA